jgi:hypothetical protein
MKFELGSELRKVLQRPKCNKFLHTHYVTVIISVIFRATSLSFGNYERTQRCFTFKVGPEYPLSYSRERLRN